MGVASLVLVGGGLTAVYTWERFSPRRVPQGQPELVTLDAIRREELRAAFNAAADRPRVLALLSPT